MTKPSDRAIAQAFREMDSFQKVDVAIAFADLRQRAREIDAAAPDGAQAVIACHRTITENGAAWAWVAGAPSLGALDNLMVHPGWRIEYAYTDPPSQDAEDAARDKLVCSRCKLRKLPTDFHSKSKRCKPCKAAVDKGRIRHPDDRVASNVGELAKARKRKWQSKGLYPERSKARRLVRTAIASGALLRPDVCDSCGNSAKRRDGVSGIQAHHRDYTKPLEVMWLCPKCHVAEDKDDAARAARGGGS
ncbi:hypothetical protein [Lysobacter capsici]|uniref:hypothetical protein n=1 Tax=Lysobacter capsici TaxID=435897 RepID=UPI00287B8F5B|nr:hypothetical protein [Lysobacter capsici]WND79436.1 hypothetical protein RJ610_19345 [Lysobacter capsici]WND84632.1 hypothetical protein RJ609_19360 [Lysobacter capsici]